MDTGPVSVANGVVYVGSMVGFPGATLGNPTMFALDARTGKQLWSFVSGGSVNSSPAIVGGRLFWGSGFSNYGLGDPHGGFFSFGPEGAATYRPFVPGRPPRPRGRARPCFRGA